MQSTKSNMRQAIDDYFAGTPDGLDVTAFVMDRIGHEDFLKRDVRAGKTFDQAKQDMGTLIKDLLGEMFREVQTLKKKVAVDPVKWPALSKWVATYTQHRVDPKSKKKW